MTILGCADKPAYWEEMTPRWYPNCYRKEQEGQDLAQLVHIYPIFSFLRFFLISVSFPLFFHPIVYSFIPQALSEYLLYQVMV